MLCFKKLQQLLPCVVFESNAVANVGPVEAHHKLRRLFEPEPRHNLVAGLLVGGGGECDSGYVGELLVQQAQLQVIGAKVMAPLRHAVRLVNGE